MSEGEADGPVDADSGSALEAAAGQPDAAGAGGLVDRLPVAGEVRSGQLLAVAGRELDTLVRTRSYAALALAFAVLVVVFPVVGGVGGYLPLVLDLLFPVEVLVPVVGFGFGVWSVLADAARGELDVVRTYPVTRTTYVLGVFLGRAVGLLGVLLLPLLAVGLVVPALREPTTSVIASHAALDSPVYLLRFAAVTAGYALVTLALAMAVSAVARSRRGGLAAAVVALLVVVVGLDALVVVGLGSGLFGSGTLGVVLGLSPASAFRGLVLATAVRGLVDTGVPAANPLVSALGLAVWFAGSLAVAIVGVWTPTDRF